MSRHADKTDPIQTAQMAQSIDSAEIAALRDRRDGDRVMLDWIESRNLRMECQAGLQQGRIPSLSRPRRPRALVGPHP